MNDYQIHVLNSFLRDEISAVETHKIAVSKMNHSSALEVLATNQASHEARIAEIKKEVLKLGGEPVTTSGLWGAFAKVVEGAAAMFSDKQSLSVLEEGEERGVNEYQGHLDKVAPTMRPLVQRLLSEQLESHRIVDGLKRAMNETASNSTHSSS